MSQHCNHHHDHDHSHHHDHSAGQHIAISKAFLIGASINFIFVVIELFYSVLAQSVSLKADAIHNLSDVLALVFSWLGYKLIRAQAESDYTFGYKKASLVIAFINSTVIFFSLFYILLEAIERFLNPQNVIEDQVIVIAAIGVFINLGSALLFKHHHHDINIKSAYMHLMVDAMISVAVVLSGILIKLTGLQIIDPVLALIVVVVMSKSSWTLFKESTQLLLSKVPNGIKLNEIEKMILSQKDVIAIHNLHVWAVSSEENAMSVHVVIKNILNHDQLIFDLTETLKNKFKIRSVTIQTESESISQKINCSIF